jgi:hypothetical protein
MDVSAHEHSDLPIDCTQAFQNKVIKYTRQLHEIDGVTKYPQTKGLSLSDGCAAIDALIDGVSSDKDNQSKPLYKCRLGTHYIAPDSDIVPDPNFESGVVKIQGKWLNYLTNMERIAVECFKVATADIDGGADNEEPLNLSILEKIKAGNKRKQHDVSMNEYMDANFVLASAAIVERLWSLANYISTDTRKSMTPMVFEVLIFLKVNHGFWKQDLVCTAIAMAKTERSNEKFKWDAEQEGVAYGSDGEEGE